MTDLDKISEMAKSSTAKLVFSITEYKGATYVDMREYVESATYSGFTKKGIRLHADKLDEFIANLQKLKAALPKAAEQSDPPETG